MVTNGIIAINVKIVIDLWSLMNGPGFCTSEFFAEVHQMSFNTGSWVVVLLAKGLHDELLCVAGAHSPWGLARARPSRGLGQTNTFSSPAMSSRSFFTFTNVNGELRSFHGRQLPRPAQQRLQRRIGEHIEHLLEAGYSMVNRKTGQFHVQQPLMAWRQSVLWFSSFSCCWAAAPWDVFWQ